MYNDPPQPEEERRLAAIMFTDMVGYTVLAHGSEAPHHNVPRSVII